MYRSNKYNFFSTDEIKVGGWLKRQLEIQAEGLAGNLDKVWSDVRDSMWIGGHKDGWERVPYWLDGFIPLAYLLENQDMIDRAKKYIDAILAQQQDDGWICPSAVIGDGADGVSSTRKAVGDEGREKYDTWAVLLISKVLILYYDCSKDERALNAVRRTLKQFNTHLDKYPLFNWGKYRWFEGLIAIYRLYEIDQEEWLLTLADKLRKQGFDYESFMKSSDFDEFKLPQHEWGWNAHVVNYAMALKANLLDYRSNEKANANFSREMLEILQKYHGMAIGHFTGDEMFSGTSPIQGTELCGIAEAMYSCEVNFAVSGDIFWLDHCEKLAFNGFSATCSEDMWTHQYDQQTNQIGCVVEPQKIWSCNSGEAGCFGLEPHFGCCTANMGQAWPKLALSSFMRSDKGILSAILVPASLDTEINGVQLKITLETRYPFGNKLVYTVEAEKEVEFELGIRIPSFIDKAVIGSREYPNNSIAAINCTWQGKKQVEVDFITSPKLQKRPNGLYFVQYGSLLFSLPIEYRKTIREYTKDGIERKFPYCDYEISPVSNWNYGFANTEFELQELEIGEYPFSQETPPIVILAKMRQIEWKIKDGFIAVANELPESTTPIGEIEIKKLIPYGATMLRMTEMPLLQ